MKNISSLMILLAAMGAAGCAGMGNKLALGTVGPVPSTGDFTERNATNGTLLVYSGYKVNADFNARDAYVREYSDYKILSADRKVLQAIHNNSGTILSEALPVSLPAGKYFVVARANGYGIITVPVLVAAGRSTVLHLEAGGAWPDAAQFNATNSIRLPDGQIVGWNAAVNY